MSEPGAWFRVLRIPDGVELEGDPAAYAALAELDSPPGAAWTLDAFRSALDVLDPGREGGANADSIRLSWLLGNGFVSVESS